MSLHTNHRPKTLGEVLGQDHVIPSLKRVLKDGRAHTFLFSGPAGTGKTTLARIVANAFSNNQGTIANIEEIAAAHTTGVEDMRQVVNRSLHRAIGASPIKAIILDECHRLSGAAWDELLKPTEEPPKHVYWLFCTTNPGKVPKTILTRCLCFDLKPVSEELICELLVSVADAEGLNTPDEVIIAIAEAAGGSPRQALVGLERAAHALNAAEARVALKSANQSPEAVNLGQFLISGRKSWADAIKLLKALEGAEAESIRIGLVNYLSVVLMNTKGDDKAAKLLGTLELFLTPYQTSDRMAPLLHSIGLAMNLDR